MMDNGQKVNNFTWLHFAKILSPSDLEPLSIFNYQIRAHLIFFQPMLLPHAKSKAECHKTNEGKSELD
jgi:hypothetical protein